MSVDPLSQKYPELTPYQFASNRPIDGIDLDGLEFISIHTQSFAPFERFGGPFHGDGNNRKFGGNPSASSRISGEMKIFASILGIELDVVTGKGSPSENLWTGQKAYSYGYLDAELKDGLLKFHNYGANALAVPYIASSMGIGNIDVFGNIQMERIDLGDDGSVIIFTGLISGDDFPSNEAFVTDQFGNSVILGVSGAEGSPFTDLPAINKGTMSAFNIGIKFDFDGRIESVIDGDGKQFSPADWNKLFSKLDPKDGDVNTGSNAAENGGTTRE